jgi:hypothetical protein
VYILGFGVRAEGGRGMHLREEPNLQESLC